MKFTTQIKKTYFVSRTLLWSRFLLFFVHILKCFIFALYLHLTFAKNLQDLAGTRGLKTKSKAPMKKGSVGQEFVTYVLYWYLDQIFFVKFSSGKS